MTPEQLAKLPANLRVAYIAALPEIRYFQAKGHDEREKLKLNPLVEHNALTREMHEVEWMCLKELVPGLKSKDMKEKLKAVKWLCRQDWGKDYRASPYEQRYWAGHDFSDATQ